MAFSRFLVGDKFGNILTELSPDIGQISWRLNKVGKVKFFMASTDPKAIKDYLKYGNRVLIEFENGLPNWGGIIDPPRAWDGSNIRCASYSALQIFKYRQTDKGRYFSNDPVGIIFQSLIQETNEIEDTGVKIGTIWTGGELHSPDYHFKDLLTIFQNSLTKRMSTSDFDFVPSISQDKIIFTANFYDSKGSDKSQIALIDGENVSGMKLTEQGPIINWWDAAGEGTNWGTDRLTANVINSESLSLYGLRQNAKVYADVSVQSTLDNNAANLLDKSEWPYNVFEIEVQDVEPAGFADYDLGDIVSLTAPDYGFEGTDTTVRILGRGFKPDSGICNLLVQEVLGD